MELPQLYIELLKHKLTDFKDKPATYYTPLRNKKKLAKYHSEIEKLQEENLVVCEAKPYDPFKRAVGNDWFVLPEQGETMIGLVRLENIHQLFKQIVEQKIEGDLVETGVWRGGACIFMNALNKVYDNSQRKVWVFDSFEGFPPAENEADKKYSWEMNTVIPLHQVKKNFKKYNLLDECVEFQKGWFKDTTPKAPINKIALLRLDGDMYGSTMDVLENLYPKVSKGGYIIIDDYGFVDCCSLAVNDFRERYNITSEIKKIDWTGVYWQKD